MTEEEQMQKEWRQIVIDDLKVIKEEQRVLNEKVSSALSIQKDVSSLKNRIETLESHSITKAEFEPLKKIVWGVVTAILLGVVAGVLALIFKGGAPV